METDKKFPEGVRAFRPRENAPDFLKLNVLIDKSRFIAWLDAQEGEEIRLDLLASKKEGNPLYFSLNTWKKESTPQNTTSAEAEYNSLGGSL